MPGPGKFTPKQDRQAKHIAASEEKRGKSPSEAKRIAYGYETNVQKQQSQKKGGKKS